MSVEKQVTIIYAATNGYLDDVPVEKVQEFEAAFLRFMDSAHPEILSGIAAEKRITDEMTDKLVAAIGEFKQGFSY
jgi:F-type H+-transporting ATPase subunit alpha